MKFLFCFGYENPDEYETNNQFGTDFESSHAVWIPASDAQKALIIGVQYAKDYVAAKYQEAGVIPLTEWNESSYAFWIEEDPQSKWPQSVLDSIITINP